MVSVKEMFREYNIGTADFGGKYSIRFFLQNTKLLKIKYFSIQNDRCSGFILKNLNYLLNILTVLNVT